MTKTIATALTVAALALPIAAFAAPQHAGGHMPSDHMSMSQDAHGDAVSATAHDAKADDSNVGKTVSPVANDKNKGKHEAKGHAKTHGKH